MAVDAAVQARGLESYQQVDLAFPTERRRPVELPAAPAVPAVRRDTLFRRALLAADLVATVVTVFAVLRPAHAVAPVLLVAAAVVAVAKILDLYDRDGAIIHKRTLDEAPKLFHLATVVTLGVSVAHSALRLPGDPGTVMVLWATLLLALILARTAARRLTQALAPTERCLVVAEADDHRRVAEKLELDRRFRAAVVGHLPLLERRSRSTMPPHAALERAVRALGVHRVVIAPDGVDPSVVLDVVSRAKALGVNVSVLPRICEVIGSAVEFDDLGGMTLLGVRPLNLSRSSRIIKRGVDIVGAVTALIVTSPLLAIIAVAVKRDGGSILFRQIRVGRDGRHFEVLKFRTMVEGAHAARALLADGSAGGGLFKLRDDPRVTPVGRWLRRTSLDELPQLLNVLRGEMSLVGPRPLVVEEDELVVGFHRRRLHLKPGLTGPWQVLGSPDVRVGLEEMATIDYLYVAHWSLWQDVQVLLRTIAHVLGRRGV